MRAPYTLKSCPRCHGDLLLTRDFNGLYQVCLQCGYSREIVEHHQQEPIPREKHEKLDSKRRRLQT